MDSLIIEGTELDYTLDDKGIVANDETLIDAAALTTNGYTVTDGKLFKDDAEVELNKEFIDSFTSKSTVDIDDVNYNIGDNGDILNADGTVFKTKADYDASLQSDKPETLEVTDDKGDTITLTIDKDGNAVNETNVIVYTKDEIEKLGDDTPADLTANPTSLMEISNIKIFDDKGEVVTYQEGADGIAAYIKDVYDQGSRDKGNSAISSLFNDNPELEGFLNYTRLNGSSAGYDASKADYSKVELDKDNKAQLTTVVIDAEIARGKSKGEAERLASYLDSDGKLMEGATDALQYLNDSQAVALKARDEQDALTEEKEYDNFVNHWGTHFNENGKLVIDNIEDSMYDKVVVKKALSVDDKTYNLPDIIRRKTPDGKIVNSNVEEFYTYLFQSLPVKDTNGNVTYHTADQIERMMLNSGKTKDDYILDSFRNYTGNDMSQFVKRQMQKEEVNKVRKIRVNSFSSHGKQIKDGGSKPTGKVATMPYE